MIDEQKLRSTDDGMKQVGKSARASWNRMQSHVRKEVRSGNEMAGEEAVCLALLVVAARISETKLKRPAAGICRLIGCGGREVTNRALRGRATSPLVHCASQSAALLLALGCPITQPWPAMLSQPCP
ncbi:hypothetical protein FH972_024671 [Carpinus fangiana]|uniref:Uncharacterized protein n=1 Tax=Carpinus fangiana TaxID=176857 RepID=A0A5N6KYN3_9ROSI|nr:hypothetical protein FH972_024671 [Carpinus fangiana]